MLLFWSARAKSRDVIAIARLSAVNPVLMRFLRNKFASIWIFGLLSAVCVWLVTLTTDDVFSRVDTLIFDSYQRLKPRIWAGSDVTIIDIDEASIRRVGQWPWPRSTIAELTEKIGALEPAAIVFDIVFSEEDRTSPLKAIDQLRRAGAQLSLPSKTDILDNDAVLAETVRRHRVVTGMIFSGNASAEPPDPKAGTGFGGSVPPGLMRENVKAVRNLKMLDDAAIGIGEFGFEFDTQTDSVVRRVKLMRGANDRWYPSLAAEALRVAQGAGGFKIKSSDGSGEFNTSNLRIVSVQIGAFDIPVDAWGAMSIYHSPLQDKPVLSVRDILFPGESKLDSNAIKGEITGHIVLIGTSAAGLLDLRATPLQPIVPGVTVHADIIDQIIAQDFLTRPDIASGVELVFGIIAVLVLLAVMPFANPIGSSITATSLAAVVLAGCWIAFLQYGLLFSPVVPLLSLLVAYGAAVAVNLLITEKQGAFVRDAFAHYLSPAMVDQLAQNHEALTLGGEDRELTVLFCDIRGFTSLSEGLDPTELTDLLNNFLTPMTTALLKRGATIDKYMGDAIMAFWNAPLDQDDHRVRACKALIDIRKQLKRLNETAPRTLDIGIGLNTGLCCVGNLGSEQRFNYSAIGDAVNVASRIEGLTKQYGLDNLVAEETLDGAEDVVALEVDRVGVLGRTEPLTVYTLLGRAKKLDGEIVDEISEAHERMLDCYRTGDIEGGLVAMTQAERAASKANIPSMTRLYAVYAERFAIMREEGVPDGWDGVFRATSK